MAPNMVALARKNNPEAGFCVMDCRDIGAIDARYDFIICGFCRPYLLHDDCEKFISDSALLLNKGGGFSRYQIGIFQKPNIEFK